jgi:hypothetical protein
MLATAASWTSPWPPSGYRQNFSNAALAATLEARIWTSRQKDQTVAERAEPVVVALSLSAK